MKILSLYCGAGGIDEGLRQAGLKTTLAIDKDPLCVATMRGNHPDTETIQGNVEDFLESVGKFDIIVGGPPCQPFSRGNTKRTLDMKDVETFWKFVYSIKPKFYLMENVEDIKTKLAKYSHRINCASYGVPQQRIRRFYTNLPLPAPTHSRSGGVTVFGKKLEKTPTIGQVLGWKYGYITKLGFSGQNGLCFSRGVNELSFTITQGTRYVKTDIPYYKGDTVDYASNEKLTVKELQLLQGFPSSYVFFGFYTDQKRQIANAVPPIIIKEFFNECTL